MSKKINVLIGEDHQLYREAFTNYLSHFNIFIVRTACNGLECLDAIEKQKPDIVLLDLEMPIMDGKEAFNKIKERYPKIKIIICSQYDNISLQNNFRNRGADGYITKLDLTNGDIIVNEIKRIVSGKLTKTNSKTKLNHLYSKRERQIIPLLCEGKTAGEIAIELKIGIKAVEKHRANLFKKTGTKNFAHLIKHFCKLGLDFLDKE